MAFRASYALVTLVTTTGLVLFGCPFQSGGITDTTGAGAGGMTGSTSSVGGSTTNSTSHSTSSTGAMPKCGDGHIDSGEECDNGTNNSDTGDCTTMCKVATCGDGFVWMGHEDCDLGTGNSDTGDCTTMCKNAACGDGFVWSGHEECDKGPSNSDTGDCLNTCKNPTCGDGFVWSGHEECDQGMNNKDTGDCTTVCKNATCGDGKVWMGHEECDDSNLTPGDGCSPGCKQEHPETCPGTAISLATGQMLTIMGDTTGATDKVSADHSGGCNCGGSCHAPDDVYQVKPSANGMLTANLSASYNGAWLHLRSACPGDQTSEIDCHFNSGMTTAVGTAVTAGQTYYVIVDSYNGGVGAYTLKLQLQ